MDLNAVAFEVAKLQLEPGDVLLVKCLKGVLPLDHRIMLQSLVKPNRVLFYDKNDVEFSVVHKSVDAPVPVE